MARSMEGVGVGGTSRARGLGNSRSAPRGPRGFGVCVGARGLGAGRAGRPGRATGVWPESSSPPRSHSGPSARRSRPRPHGRLGLTASTAVGALQSETDLGARPWSRPDPPPTGEGVALSTVPDTPDYRGPHPRPRPRTGPRRGGPVRPAWTRPGWAGVPDRRQASAGDIPPCRLGAGRGVVLGPLRAWGSGRGGGGARKGCAGGRAGGTRVH